MRVKRYFSTFNFHLSTPTGFTLVELLLYVGVIGVVMSAVVTLLTLMMTSQVKNQTIIEVEQQGAAVMRQITQSVRNASAINSPAVGVTGSTLNITVGGVTTIYDTANVSGATAFRLTEGAGSPIELTSPKITVSGVSFQSLTRTSTPGTIKIQFTVSYNNNTGKQEYNYSKTFYGSASLR